MYPEPIASITDLRGTAFVRRGDDPSASKLAHTLKGTAANMSAESLRGRVERLAVDDLVGEPQIDAFIGEPGREALGEITRLTLPQRSDENWKTSIAAAISIGIMLPSARTSRSGVTPASS